MPLSGSMRKAQEKRRRKGEREIGKAETEKRNHRLRKRLYLRVMPLTGLIRKKQDKRKRENEEEVNPKLKKRSHFFRKRS